MMDLQMASLFASGAFIIIGLFAAIFIDNLIKKIIGIAFIEEGANLFLICLGYKAGGVVPIFLPGMNADWFAGISSYKYCNWCKYFSSNVGFSYGFI